MKLNHINLIVTNVTEAIHFFETYFEFNCVDIKGNDAIAILRGAGNFVLVLMAEKYEQPNYPKAFHIGFLLDNKDQITEKYLQLKNNGINIQSEPTKIRNGFGFYFTFDNIMIEVAQDL